MERECSKHGVTSFKKREGSHGWRCRKCASEAVSKRRRKVKELLVREFGGRCSRCGYSKCMRALEFHHLDPKKKEFGLARHGVTRSIERARAEASKCILLCSNCHAEVEDELITNQRL